MRGNEGQKSGHFKAITPFATASFATTTTGGKQLAARIRVAAAFAKWPLHCELKDHHSCASAFACGKFSCLFAHYPRERGYAYALAEASVDSAELSGPFERIRTTTLYLLEVA